MAVAFINSFRSEWLKKKRTAASWLVIAGGFFIPAIIIIARMINHETIATDIQSPQFWEKIHRNCWQFMAIMLLPMGVILATSLIGQIEFRNNTWKQLHTSPQSLTQIFAVKYLLVLIMMLQFFILFTIGIYLAGILPSVFTGNPFPSEPFPIGRILLSSGRFFLSCLPILGLQYLLSMQFRNFLVPLGAGIALLVASLIAMQWKYNYLVPYTFPMLEFFGNKTTHTGTSMLYFSFGYFSMFTIAAYILYIRKKVKG